MTRSAVSPFLAGLLAVAAAVSGSCAARQGERSAPADVIVFNISQDPHSLDPILARSDDERQIAHLAFDMLLDVDARGQQTPALATEIPSVANGGISRDGLTITYRLRRGVRWHDGAPFTSQDVWFTWRAILDPRNNVQSTRGYDEIAAIDTPDPHTAIVRLKRPWAPAVETLFTYGSAPMPIVPAHLLEHRGPLNQSAFNERPVGTGPYRLVRWARGQELDYAVNGAYFRGRPRTPRVTVQVVPDTNTDLAMLRGGQLDWSLLSPAQRLSLTRAERLKFVYAPFAGFGALAFNCRDGAFFADVRARRLVASAIDRIKLSAGVTHGQYPITDTDQPHFSWAYDSAVRLPRYDPGNADRELDRMGWARGSNGMRSRNGRQLQLILAVFPESDTAMRTAVYVQEMLRLRGIDVAIKRVSLAQFYLPAAEGGLLMSGRFDIAYFAWRSGEDPDDSDLVACGAPANYAGYCSAKVDALERAAMLGINRASRAVLYAAIQRMLADDLPYYYLYAPRYSYAARTGLRGLAPTPFSATWNSYEWLLTQP